MADVSPPDLVRQELARLMESESLRRAPSHARLLRYLVERRVANDEPALRETSIALEVFRRDPATYDPRTDPIVRVTVGRLRERLESHYAHYDAPPKMRIVLPRGGYAPEFVPMDPGPGRAPAAGIAVLRTRNLTGDDALGPACDGFADQLADRLAAAGLPRVIARASVDHAQAASADPATLGLRLEVPWLVDSTLARERRSGLRLSVRLLGVDADVRWVETAIGENTDLYRLVDRMLDAATLRIAGSLPAGARAQPARGSARPALADAARAALDRSRLLLLQRTVAATDEAVALAQAVVDELPSAADAWATLAAALYSRYAFHDKEPAPIADRLVAAAERALALDAEQPVALRTLAIILGKFRGDFGAAEDLFRRALASSPHYTSVRLNYAELLTFAGRAEDALEQLALARLHDPLSASVSLARGTCLHLMRRYDEADAAWALARAAGDNSEWRRGGEIWTALAAGRLDDALAKITDLHAAMPPQGGTLLCLASVLAARGDRDGALALERECVARFPWHSSAQRALPAAYRRDRAETLRLLAEGLDRHDSYVLNATMDPALDWLVGDADYARLRRRSPIWAARG